MRIVAVLLVTLWPGLLAAQDKAFRLAAPAALHDSGFLKHLTPRFSLKTQIRITPVGPGEAAEAAFGDTGTPVFADTDRIWHLSETDHPGVARFREWLLSEVGKRTIEAFAPNGSPAYTTAFAAPKQASVATLSGDAVRGETLSLKLCGRCHVIGDKNRMNGMGASPSFPLLRTFDDWQDRFASFFALKPHPAFTQVADVTPPFPENLPSPIVPVELTLDDLDAILAFVSAMAPADLGKPLQTQ